MQSFFDINHVEIKKSRKN